MTELRLPARGVSRALTDIFQAAGGSEDEARAIADNLVEANLTGHDSHGVVRTQHYVEWVLNGAVFFDRHVEMVIDADAFALLDGGNGFGQVLGREAVEVGLDKASRQGVSIVALRKSGHLGRIGAWAERACRAGFVSVHFVNVQNSRLVAPYGGAAKTLSTAPFCVGVPNGGAEDFILDFATSRIAEGKANIAFKGQSLAPPDAIVDADGQLTGDPKALYGDIPIESRPDPRKGPGALAPMGGHKGSGLAVACELLAGALTGSGAGGPGSAIHNGMLSIYIDPDRLDDGHGWGRTVRDYVAQFRACPPAKGVEQVLIPGDPERARRAERERSGLPLSRGVWDSILSAGAQVGLAREDLERVARTPG